MIAIECDKCGKTSYTADPKSCHPCPMCGQKRARQISLFKGLYTSNKGVRPLGDEDRVRG